MNRRPKRFLLIPMLLLLLVPIACQEEESELGFDLQDPSTRYAGTWDTITGADLIATTCFDDSLLTSGYTAAMIGHYADGVFGKVEARFFTQLSLEKTSSLNFEDGCDIDSVRLILKVQSAFGPAPSKLHLRVSLLGEELKSEELYYASSSLPLAGALLDTVFSAVPDSLALPVDGLKPLLMPKVSSQDEFHSRIKGLCVELLPDSDPVLLALNLASSATQCKVYFRHLADAVCDSIAFLVGYNGVQTGCNHFVQFTHDYAVSPIAPIASGAAKSLPGNTSLYLEPLGGTFLNIDIDAFLQRFRKKHPFAVVNYAELLLPVDNSTISDNFPKQLLAYKIDADGNATLVRDMSNGVDGTFYPSNGYYRLRLTQHFQGLLREGADYGTRIYLNARRTSGERVVLQGSDVTNGARLIFIYTEN